MKLVSFQHRDRDQAAILSESAILPLAGSMKDVILNPALLNSPMEPLPLDAVDILAPIPHPEQDIICMGMNYAEHAEEAFGYSAQAFESERSIPVFFSKRATYCQGAGGIIPAHADLTQRLDYEAELAVILGKDALNVPEER